MKLVGAESAIIAAVTGGLAFLLGARNVAFIYLINASFIIELWLRFLIGKLDLHEDFDFKAFIKFMLMKSVLVMAPATGIVVDYALYYIPEVAPENFERTWTKLMLLGVLSYQVKEIAPLFLLAFKDFWPIKRLMHFLDIMMKEEDDPKYRRRKYDPPFDSETPNRRKEDDRV